MRSTQNLTLSQDAMKAFLARLPRHAHQPNRRSVLNLLKPRGTGEGADRARDRDRANARHLSVVYSDVPVAPESRQVRRRRLLKDMKRQDRRYWRHHFKIATAPAPPPAEETKAKAAKPRVRKPAAKKAA